MHVLQQLKSSLLKLALILPHSHVDPSGVGRKARLVTVYMKLNIPECTVADLEGDPGVQRNPPLLVSCRNLGSF